MCVYMISAVRLNTLSRLAESVKHDTLKLGVVGSKPTSDEYCFQRFSLLNRSLKENSGNTEMVSSVFTFCVSFFRMSKMILPEHFAHGPFLWEFPSR